ncbi:abortive infection protein [Candidatus Magnetoovum chiemensis]|nr:abortive infection protein [Candidatus Magnetoovum chiemensis]
MSASFTILLFIIIITVFFTIQLFTGFLMHQLIVYGIVAVPRNNEAAASLIISSASIASSSVCIFLTILAVKLRNSLVLKDYLALKPPKIKDIILWITILAFVIILIDLFLYLINVDASQPFVERVYSSTENYMLLYLAACLFAPVFEEILFRGFLFKGLIDNNIGLSNTVVITSCLWSIVHIQYDLKGLAVIFVLGVVLCLARHKSGSIFIPIGMHIFNNIVSLVITAYPE